MFAPNHVWRRWHRRVNVNLKRYATCSALAATAIPSLVMARGHKIEEVPEVPLVVADNAAGLTKTKQAMELLKKVGADKDVDKAIASKNLRRGKGKMRNRRYVMRKGPLVVYKEDSGVVRAMRNIPGVDLCHVDRLNLLQLAPGGHMGRFCIWTQSAFDSLDTIFGTQETESAVKKGFKVPRVPMANTDLARLINSDEIQSIVNAPKAPKLGKTLKKNPLKNLGAMLKLNPYTKTVRRQELALQEDREKARAAKLAEIRAGKAKSARTKDLKASAKKFVATMRSDSDYQGEDYEVFAKWLSQGHGEEKVVL